MIADPIGAVTPQYGNEAADLPDGIYDAHSSYALSTFTLDARRHSRERLFESTLDWCAQAAKVGWCETRRAVARPQHPGGV